MGPTSGTCDSCAALGEDLVAVYRVFVLDGSSDTPVTTARLADVESWCRACRTRYPHDVAGTSPTPD